jgi:putative endonuclease
VNLFQKLKTRFTGDLEPAHLRYGKIGERAARKFLQGQGMKFLTANFRSSRGEIDLIFRANEYFASDANSGIIIRALKNAGKLLVRDKTDCLVFVEVKARSSEEWGRPASAVDADKRRLISLTALDYLQRLRNPEVKIRFDIVEVLLTEGRARETRHLPNTFSLSKPYQYG